MKTPDKNRHGRVWKCITPDDDQDHGNYKENYLRENTKFLTRKKNIQSGNTNDILGCDTKRTKKLFNPVAFNQLQCDMVNETAKNEILIKDYAAIAKPTVWVATKDKRADIVKRHKKEKKDSIISSKQDDLAYTSDPEKCSPSKPSDHESNNGDDDDDDDDIELTVTRIPRNPAIEKTKVTKVPNQKNDEIVSISDSENETIDSRKRNKTSVKCDEQILSKSCFTIKSSKSKILKNNYRSNTDLQNIHNVISSSDECEEEDVILSTTTLNSKETISKNKRKSTETCPMCRESFPVSQINTHAIDCNGRPISPLSKRTRQSVLTSHLSSIPKANRMKAKVKPVKFSTDKVSDKPTTSSSSRPKNNSSLDNWNAACEKLKGVHIAKPATDNHHVNEGLKAKTGTKAAQYNKAAAKDSFEQFEKVEKDKFAPNTSNTILIDDRPPGIGLWESESEDEGNAVRKSGQKCSSFVKSSKDSKSLISRKKKPVSIDNGSDDGQELNENMKTKPSHTQSKISSLRKKKQKAVSIKCDTTDDELDDSIMDDVINQYLFPGNCEVDNITPIAKIAPSKSEVKSPDETEECYMCGKHFPSGKPYQRHVDYEIRKMNAMKNKNRPEAPTNKKISVKKSSAGATLAESLGNRKSWSSFKYGSSKSNKQVTQSLEIDDDDISNSPIKSFRPVSNESVFDFSSQFTKTNQMKGSSDNSSSYDGKRPKYKRTKKRR